MSRNYYIVLGISSGADLEKIKRAYRTIAMSSHPDVSKSEETAQKFRSPQRKERKGSLLRSCPVARRSGERRANLIS